jgi:hypothetical protein
MTRLDGPGRRSAQITTVSGGEVLAAEYADLDRLAERCAHAGLRLLGWSTLPTETLVDPDLLASAVLAPFSFARVEAALGALLLGADALPVAAVEWEGLGGAVVGAKTVIEVGDSAEVQRLWLDAKEAVFVEGTDLPWPDRAQLALGGDVALTAAALGTGGVGAVSRAVSLLYGGETGVRTQRVPITVPGSCVPPRDVLDLATHLSELSRVSDARHPENDGTIEVQTFDGPDGTRRHVVYLPGTDDMNPFSSDGQLRDMQENTRLVGGEGTAYAAGVMAALRDAGVRPGEPVLLAGHSQGGMVAAALASHASPYDVTNVVTFGSPTSQVAHYPAHVHVLSLEHQGDLVPQLAGPGTASAHHVTVQFASGIGGLEDNHSFAHYTAGAAAVDASTDPDVASSRHALAGFFAGGQHAHSQVFQLTRTAS